MTLDEMAERAQRHLDGMTVNKDAMARDVLALVGAIKAAQARRPRQQTDGFAAAFDELFSDIFGTANRGRPTQPPQA